MAISMPDHIKQGPQIHMAPLIDIVFLTLILFMYISAFSQMESDLDISIPKSTTAADAARTPGEIVVNITKDGQFIVNDQSMNAGKLEEMLKDVSALFPNQQVIIRADEEAYHKFIVAALDACARASIWDISFATLREGETKR